MTRILASSAIAAALLPSLGCGRAPRPARPDDVPPAAAYVGGGKIGGWWQECALVTSLSAHCRIWNAGGLLLYDEEFLPYDQRPLTAAEIRIPEHCWDTFGDRICLSNERVLLPRSNFDRMKRMMDDSGGEPPASDRGEMSLLC